MIPASANDPNDQEILQEFSPPTPGLQKPLIKTYSDQGVIWDRTSWNDYDRSRSSKQRVSTPPPTVHPEQSLSSRNTGSGPNSDYSRFDRKVLWWLPTIYLILYANSIEIPTDMIHCKRLVA